MTTSLATLLTNTRDYIDESSASRWSEAKLTRYVNQGVNMVQSHIERSNEKYFLRVEVATAAAGSYELAFPSNIWGSKMHALYYYDNSTVATGTPYKVPPASLEQVYDNLNVSGTPAGYTNHAGFLRWAPLLSNTGTFRFIYSLKETPLSATGQNLAQIGDEFSDAISLYAGIMARQDVGAPTAALENMLKLRLGQVSDDVTPTDPVTFFQVSIDD